MGRWFWSVLFALASLTCFASEAPNEGSSTGYWSSGIKQAFGTAYETYDTKTEYSAKSSSAPLSKVWFTAAQGVLTEVFWPTIDAAQVRDNQILVSDGQHFFFEERTMAKTKVEWIRPGVPLFKVTNEDPQGRFKIEKEIFADPDRDVIIQAVRIERRDAKLKFYVLHNPAVSNTPRGDSAEAVAQGDNAGLYAWQADQAQALIANIPFARATAGFEGSPSDGFQDIRRDYRLDSEFTTAKNGNVVLTAQLDVPESTESFGFILALGFGSTVPNARSVAKSALAAWTDSRERYQQQWLAYLKTLKALGKNSPSGDSLYLNSAALMKSMEDKTYPGGFVASPSVPWGLHRSDNSDQPWEAKSKKHMVSGYHVVWPRDLFQMATGFMAIGDPRSAIASLNYLRQVQYGPEDGEWHYGPYQRSRDGSFPQNCWLDGENNWGGLQLDEVGMPIVLAFRLWKDGHIRLADYWDMIRRAGDFVLEFGPWSPQERWEEIFGLSPSTIAAEIAGLKAGAFLADAMGDRIRAKKYFAKAEEWLDSSEAWMFTKTGKHGDGKYFVRVEAANSFFQIWNPDDDFTLNLANGAGTWREKDVVDAGFLEWVRFGLMGAKNESIRGSLPEVDSTIGVDLPGIGTGYRRYLGDRYNYDESTNQQTLGMPWPLLTGERGHYEIAAALADGKSAVEVESLADGYLASIEKMATPSYMIPEQIWDSGLKMGKPTGAATPLGWAHAEYVKLLRTKSDGRVFDHLNF